mmetsp:Transcript_65726/g.182999  ORF Transcript_65726/g.182999 Transcript_65726/m.182999 type:complete len:347 (+) Transcript_65726:98-1138(+)
MARIYVAADAAVSAPPPRKWLPRLAPFACLLLAALALAATLGRAPALEPAFVGSTKGLATGSGLLAAHGWRTPSRRVPLWAEQFDAELIDDEDEEEEMADEEPTASVGIAKRKAFPPEAFADYPYNVDPPDSWFERRKIDRHKVNEVFFDMFKKPKRFFPHDLRPGDTVRIFFKEPSKGEVLTYTKTRKVFFDGVILTFKGDYHTRIIRVRAMVGKGLDAVGYEMTFPMHSPLVTRIEVLRRGYIGRNKNAYFLRGMIGKKNQVPLDQERTKRDALYRELKEANRADEIPEPDYPKLENDMYPLPVWKQDMDDWDEAKYSPEIVDKRSEYEKRVIGAWRKRVRPKK